MTKEEQPTITQADILISPAPTEIDCKTCFGEGWYWNALLHEERPCTDCDGLGSHPIGDTHDK